MVEGRELLSGESGRTGGHLSNALDSGYRRMASRHGDHGAQIAADSHSWAIRRVYDVSRRLGVECEYRQLPCYKISQYQQTDDRHQEEVRQLREEATKAKMFNLSVSFREGYAIRGWDGAPNQRDAAVYEGQTVFHPVKYMVGVLTWLKNQPNFACYTLTRVVSIEERVSRQSGKDSNNLRTLFSAIRHFGMDRLSQLKGKPAFSVVSFTSTGENPAWMVRGGGHQAYEFMVNIRECGASKFENSTTKQSYYKMALWQPRPLFKSVAPTPVMVLIPEDDLISSPGNQHWVYDSF
ncbi:hypothetical protein MMC16_005803 [Acarospora aff. strigata]|nr:hypothetical protein [Acarospora aff. strigata]